MSKKGYILYSLVSILLFILSILFLIFRANILKETDDILLWMYPTIIVVLFMLLLSFITNKKIKEYEYNNKIDKLKQIEFTIKKTNINISDLKKSFISKKYKKINEYIYRKYRREKGEDGIKIYEDNIVFIEQQYMEVIDINKYCDSLRNLDEITNLCYIYIRNNLDYHLKYIKEYIKDVIVKSKDVKEVYPVIIYDNNVYYIKYGIVNKYRKNIEDMLNYLGVEYK